jgi:ketosteroid isomerase-like protein
VPADSLSGWKGEILGAVSEQENVDAVGAFIEAYNSGDVDRIETLCTDECEIAGIRASLEETSYVGPQAVRRYWADATEIWSERHLDVEKIGARGDDTVIVRALWRGRGQGSGAQVERQLGFRFRLEGGRIASFRTFVNAADAG